MPEPKPTPFRGETGGDDSVVLHRLFVTAAVFGWIIDIAKPLFYRDWQPFQRWGWFLLLIYAATNAVSYLFARHSRRVVKDWYDRYFAIGLIYFFPGVLANLLETGLIPVVWHGAIGFFVALTVAFRRFFTDLLERWQRVPDTPQASDELQRATLEVRKELVKEMQWAFTTHTQVWVAFTAIFGVSMTIVFKEPASINDANFKATGLQMTLGFGACLFLAYLFGIAHALRIMQSVRSDWITAIRCAPPRCGDQGGGD